MSDGVLEARTSVAASALSAFRRTGDLDLLVATNATASTPRRRIGAR